MGVDPISLGLIFAGGSALAGPGAGLIAAGGAAALGLANKKKDKKSSAPGPIGPPPAPVEQIQGVGKKTKKYREPAQVFRDDDLRLGSAGMLGRIG